MKQKKFWSQLILFVSILLALIITREYVATQLINNGIESYQTHLFLGISVNVILALVSYFFIQKNGLTRIGGIKGTTLTKWYLLLFPLIYLVILNGVFIDEPTMKLFLPNIGILAIYVISIGFAEELSIRGFLQAHLINRFGTSKKNISLCVFIASLFFGIIHLIKFNKGIYGEISQVFYATFIGVMFGFLLIVTKRIYPLIIIHAIIDFVAKLDSTGVPVQHKIADPMSLENAALSTLLISPCLIYGLFLMKKHINQ